MTFGLRNAESIVVVLAICLLPSPQPAGAVPPSSSAPLNLGTISDLLRKDHHVEVRFTEQHYSSLLKEPMRSQGTLGFTPPARIEKHVTSPGDELFVADGDKVFIVDKPRNLSRTLNVDDHPALRAFVEALRSLLAGHLETLRQYFRLTLIGSLQRWTLTAMPNDSRAAEFVSEIRFIGAAGNIERIDILETGGDRSELRLHESTP